MPETEDLYEILHLHPSAHQDVIQAAYRRLALLYHPDKNPSPEATDIMAAVNRAYAVLSDPEQRAEYDRGRAAQADSVGASDPSAASASQASRAQSSAPRNPTEYFTLGSTKSDVADIHGPPRDVSIDRAIREEVWHYGSDDIIEFDLDTGRVQGWSNIRGNLRISLVPGPNVRPDVSIFRYFEAGDHRDTIARLQGTPTIIIARQEFNREIWIYFEGIVEFSFATGQVVEWENSNGRLKGRRTISTGDWVTSTDDHNFVSTTKGGTRTTANNRTSMLLVEFDGRNLSMAVYWGFDVSEKEFAPVPVGLSIDGKRAQRQRWYISALKERTDAPSDKTVEAIQALIHAEKLRVRVRPRRQRPVTVTFELNGAQHAVGPVLDAWRRAGSPAPGHTAQPGCLPFLLPVGALGATAVVIPAIWLAL